MEHDHAGANFTPDGVVLVCTAGCTFPPVPIGRGWIEELQRLWDEHLEAL